MKLLSIFLSLTVLSQSVIASSLQQMKLVSVQTEMYPDITYVLGLDLDQSGKPIGMFYFDPTKGEKAELHYSFEQLAHEPQLISRYVKKDQQKVYDVIKLGLKESTITIAFQKDARKNKWTEQTLKLECDSSHKNCVIRDPETDKTTSALYVPNHIYLGHWVTGVDSIEIR